MKYFAYGSNMSASRLKGRVPNAERIGMFFLDRHCLRFHKSSSDGSGKCDAYKTGSPKDTVIGALFEISESEKPALDHAEGLGYGYDEKIVNVYNENGAIFETITYYATNIDPELKPYSWYLNHVIIGANETGVPNQYLETIQCVVSVEDPDKNRDTEQRAIHR